MQFSEDFFKEEVRWDHVVTEKTKKVWAVELNLLEKLDQVCRKHNLQYYAGFGTLLGVVRHQGFIPWDDDIDVVMFRPDYEKLKTIAASEFTEPYVFQDEYSDGILRGFCKLRDSRTTAIEKPDAPASYHQGIFIDIFVWDDGQESPTETTPVWEMMREMWMALTNPTYTLELLGKENHLLMPADILRFLATDTTGQGYKMFHTFASQNTGKTSKIQLFFHEFNRPGYGYPRSCFDETVYLPFEGFQIPAPAGYETMLRHQFGDYMTPVKFASLHNGVIIDPDRPYTEVLKELTEG